MDQWVGAKCVLVWGKGTGVGTSVPRTLLCSEHPSLILVPWPGLPGHAQILNYVASLTDHLSQGPRDIPAQTSGLSIRPCRPSPWRGLQLNRLKDMPGEGQLAPLSQGAGTGPARAHAWSQPSFTAWHLSCQCPLLPVWAIALGPRYKHIPASPEALRKAAVPGWGSGEQLPLCQLKSDLLPGAWVECLGRAGKAC